MTKNNKVKKDKLTKKVSKQVSKKKNDVKKIESELNSLKDKHIRLKAEFENFRRRKSEEISRLLQYEGETVIKGFLPILDDINRMMAINNTSEKLKQIDSKGTFESDDEVGFFFEQIKNIQLLLDNLFEIEEIEDVEEKA